MNIILIIGIIIIIFVIYEFNIFVNLMNKVKHSKSSIDIYLMQRFDLIPNLVECVKGYAAFEKETFQAIAGLRENYNNTKDLITGQDLTNQMNIIMARAEEMPELEASEQFQILQRTLIRLESQIQAARRIYNGDVTLYNTTIQSFPNNIAAKFFNMKPMELFTIDEYIAKNIKVEV